MNKKYKKWKIKDKFCTCLKNEINELKNEGLNKEDFICGHKTNVGIISRIFKNEYYADFPYHKTKDTGMWLKEDFHRIEKKRS